MKWLSVKPRAALRLGRLVAVAAIGALLAVGVLPQQTADALRTVVLGLSAL